MGDCGDRRSEGTDPDPRRPVTVTSDEVGVGEGVGLGGLPVGRTRHVGSGLRHWDETRTGPPEGGRVDVTLPGVPGPG